MNMPNAVGTTSPYETFETINSHRIDLLNLTLEEYQHKKTGARHVHLASDDPHNVFLVSFLTVPQDSKGVAHILEHTALCGSKHYDVRDPFFMMIRRSLNTFMNAFTASDWTAYPFATLNKKDFANLLDVYLDAAFFPNLHPLDFAQEGHRLEYTDAQDPNSPLAFKGVVYNEMKGVLSSPKSRLAQHLQSGLFPTVTYHHNSGGDPEAITELSYDELKAFHAKHYHPSNALFFTYGDIPAHEHQKTFETKVLQHFDRLDIDFSVPNEQRYSEPQYFTHHYPLNGDESAENNTYTMLGWLMDPVSDIESLFENQLLEAVLLDNSASPLLAALEQSDLGTAPAPYCGFEGDLHETIFAAGLQGSNPEQADAVEALILETLESIVHNGIPKTSVNAMLHQFELSQREISGGQFPYGLQIIMAAIGVGIHNGDIAKALDLDPQLAILRKKAQDPNFIPQLIQRKLLDNPHRVRIVLAPDAKLAEQEAKSEQDKLDRISASLTEEDQQRIIAQAKQLEDRQNQKDDPSLLPKVTLNDVAKTMNIPEYQRTQVGDIPATIYHAGTNGLFYQKVIMPLPKLSDDELEWLPLYCALFGELGTKSESYQDIQSQLSGDLGSISMSMMLRPNTERDNQLESYLAIATKALADNATAAANWIIKLLREMQFSERKHIREIIQQIRANKISSVIGSGHIYIMGAASASISGLAARQLEWDGLSSAIKYKTLGEQLEDDSVLDNIIEQLSSIHSKVQKQPIQLLGVAEQKSLEDWTETQQALWQDFTPCHALNNPAPLEQPTLPPKTAWVTSSQVNYVGAAYKAVHANHPDAPALHVLAAYLRNIRLHTLIREKGGAYGGGATFAPDVAAFRFFSYRDPRVQGTIDDFIQSAEWMATHDHDPADIEEAILGVISSIDKPSSPAGEAIGAYFAELFGATAQKREAMRQKILAVTLADLQRVAAQYLKPDDAHIAVLGDASALESLGDEYTYYQL